MEPHGADQLRAHPEASLKQPAAATTFPSVRRAAPCCRTVPPRGEKGHHGCVSGGIGLRVLRRHRRFLATVCPAEEMAGEAWDGRSCCFGDRSAGLTTRRPTSSHQAKCGTVYFSPMMRFSYAGAPEKTDQAWRGDFFTAGSDMG